MTMERTSEVVAANGRIIILESSREHLLVRWVDSGRCHYSEQRWRRGVARGNGSCALSGILIRRGEAVYRPNGRPAPVNHGAMIALRAVFASY